MFRIPRVSISRAAMVSLGFPQFHHWSAAPPGAVGDLDPPPEPEALNFPNGADGAWENDTPSNKNMTSEGVDATASSLGGSGLIIRDANIVKSWGSGQTLNTDWASASKVVISMLLWKAVADGVVSSVNALLATYDTAHTFNAKDDGITFYHLGHQLSGFGRPEDPGVAVAYNDYAINAYARALIGADIYNDTPTNIFNNEFVELQFQNTPTLNGSTNICRLNSVSIGDFARIAWLVIAKGKWKTTQIIPASYFTSMMATTVPIDAAISSGGNITPSYDPGTFGGSYFNSETSNLVPGRYSWNFWNNVNGTLFADCPTDSLAAFGHIQEECFVVFPTEQIAIVWNTNNQFTYSQLNTIFSDLLATVSPL